MKKTVPLYDLPEGTKIYCKCSDGSTYIVFDHIDGMYSYSTTAKGGVVHLGATTEVTQEGDDYFLE